MNSREANIFPLEKLKSLQQRAALWHIQRVNSSCPTGRHHFHCQSHVSLTRCNHHRIYGLQHQSVCRKANMKMKTVTLQTYHSDLEGRNNVTHTILVKAVLVLNCQVGFLLESWQSLRYSHGVVVCVASGICPHCLH